jgi:thioredoxin-dependent peroxiredoxin
MALPAIGTKAPEFTLQDQDGVEHTLSEYKGQWVLVYFYPKDNTPGCTKQACTLRDAEPAFEKLDAVVLGISADSVASHKKFVDKFALPFPLLADTDKKVIEAYGSWGKKKLMGREYMGIFRNSFLINPDGMIAKAYEGVKPEKHAEEVIADIEVLTHGG